MEQQETGEGIMSPNLFVEWIDEAFPYGIIACDHAGNIVRINAAALKLFEVAATPLWDGTSYQQFLRRYEGEAQQQPAPALEPWLMSIFSHEEAASGTQEELKVLQVPSGRKVYVKIRCLPALDAQQHAAGTVSVFHDITHCSHKALHLQRVQQAVSRLQEAIAHLPEHLDCTSPEGLFLLSPPVLFVTQQLVEVIGQVLDCQDVALWAFGPPAQYLHYAAGSGFTWEQELCRREKSGHILLSEYVDETALARLCANQEVILASKRLCPRYRERYDAENLLWIPILLENRLSGALIIAKAGADSEYTPEEREAVAGQQRSAPERTIMLEVMPTEKVVPIIVDAERITQVINAYLANALSSSPLDQPVTAQLTVEDARARVSVHDEGPGIPVEEQGRIWERFYHAKEIAGPHEFDVSLGLGFYLCRAFIERQHGNVGVQSDPGRGATFWFTLPLAAEET